jgi:hypothetical protein
MGSHSERVATYAAASSAPASIAMATLLTQVAPGFPRWPKPKKKALTTIASQFRSPAPAGGR